MSQYDLDNFYLTLPEPQRGCFLALRDIILSLSDDITPEWKYKLPFFYHKKKMFCYLWMDKKTKEPYIGVTDGLLIDHSALELGDRKRMKIYRVNPEQDILVDEIVDILQQSIDLRSQ